MHPFRLIRQISGLSLLGRDQVVDADAHDRLNRMLETSDEACRSLLELSMLDAELMFRARSQEFARSADREATEWPQPAVAPRRPWAWWGVGVAAAACLAWAAMWISPRFGASSGERLPMVERAPQPVASLGDSPEAVFVDRSRQPGEEFLEGDVVKLARGEARVSMASGVDFVLKAPAVLEFISAKQVQLRRGVLSAQAAQWGSGFIVDTDEMRVIDLGTRFVVEADPDDVETHVVQGQVRVEPRRSELDGRRSVLLSEGEALRVDRGQVTPVRLPAEFERFPAALRDFRPFKPIAIHNTGLGLAEGDEDPHWRIIDGPIGGSYYGPQYGVVCVPDERYSANEPERSQWLSSSVDVRPGGLRNSVFTFATEFDLTGFDLSTVTISAQLLADNGVRSVRINGEEVPIEPWDDNEPMQLFTRNRFRSVEIRHGFLPGVNTLEIDVWNGIYTTASLVSKPNPFALRAEFQAFGRPEAGGESAARGGRTVLPASINPPPAGSYATFQRLMPRVFSSMQVAHSPRFDLVRKTSEGVTTR